MGSGKSTIGKNLARALDISFRDLDEEIEVRLNSTIPEIFKQKGEIFFRAKEAEVLEEVLQAPSEFVLASGGGTPCYGSNMERMLQYATEVIYLQCSVPELVSRLTSQKAMRPVISHIADEDLHEFVGKHLFERLPFYNRATHIIQVNEQSPEEVVDEILSVLS